ncbi:MAG: hypothetical protein OXH04_11005 [Acidobacteria bacterium]|nr:hypothetical protein [Acidobacteriota bacterium]
MTQRHLVAALLVTALAVGVPTGVAGQPPAGEAGGSAALRTAWGDPDLQGRWTNTTTTPLERPADLAERDFLTDEERAARDEAGDVAREQRGIDPGTGETGSYNNFWVERGVRMARTSLIVDPPDGRLPPLTPAEAERRPGREAYRSRVPAGPEDRNLYERCISRSLPGAMLPGFYNHNYQIFQAPGYVVILVEMVHDARIVPLDGRPHADPRIRQWLGDSRGRWEGDTLVVETTNLIPVNGRALTVFGAGEATEIVERFTRLDDGTLDYRVTVSDPTEYTRPWTASIPMASLDGLLYEYACHEGNYGLENILAGARAEETRAGAGAASR